MFDQTNYQTRGLPRDTAVPLQSLESRLPESADFEAYKLVRSTITSTLMTDRKLMLRVFFLLFYSLELLGNNSYCIAVCDARKTYIVSIVPFYVFRSLRHFESTTIC